MQECFNISILLLIMAVPVASSPLTLTLISFSESPLAFVVGPSNEVKGSVSDYFAIIAEVHCRSFTKKQSEPSKQKEPSSSTHP
jgi:hypothetical protein